MNQKNITPPKFLYRYFSFSIDKDTYTKSIFKHNELYFRNPNKFNDPFDCKPLLTLERDWNQEEYIKFVMNNDRDSKGGDLDNEEKQWYKEEAINAFINLDRNQLSRKFNKIIKKGLAKSINDSVDLVCFPI